MLYFTGSAGRAGGPGQPPARLPGVGGNEGEFPGPSGEFEVRAGCKGGPTLHASAPCGQGAKGRNFAVLPGTPKVWCRADRKHLKENTLETASFRTEPPMPSTL